MPLDPALPLDRVSTERPMVPLPGLPRESPGDGEPCRAPADLGALDDHQLYALEADRCLDPDEWHRVEAELGRRRQSRRISAADVGIGVPVPPPVTLNDLERVTANLERRVTARLAALERRARALRWWTLAAPLAWALVGLTVWGMSVDGGAGWTALAASFVD